VQAETAFSGEFASPAVAPTPFPASNICRREFSHRKASSFDDQGAKKPRNPCAVFEDNR
jgi:hypothetical protein